MFFVFYKKLTKRGHIRLDLLAYPDLADLLLYHVVENATRIGSLSQGQLLTSLEGGELEH